MGLQKNRQLLVNTVLTRINKNKYSQNSTLRLKVFQEPKGYGDCSSTMMLVYRKALNMNIGSSSAVQARNKKGLIVDVAKSKIPDESKLLPGDLIFFNYKKAKSSNIQWYKWEHRYLHVGHVEMYIGNGQLVGHGSGTGPRVTSMRSYCNAMYNSGMTYTMAKRFVYDETEYSENYTEIPEHFKMWVKELQHEIGAKEDGIPGKETLSKAPVLRKGSSGTIVSLVQRRLIDLGYDLGRYGANKDGIDGKFGAKCVSAVTSIKEWAFHDTVKGIEITVDERFWRFLLNLEM